jgi:hypothetical protein
VALRWQQTKNTDDESIWESGDYRLVGTGRMYGGGIRRDWALYHEGFKLCEPSRLSSGKRDALYHDRQKRVGELVKLVASLARLPGFEPVDKPDIAVVTDGVELGYLTRVGQILAATSDGRHWARQRTRASE